MNHRARWLVVVLFALAMAWVESAVVFYLRTMFDRIEPYQPHPFPISLGIGFAEIVREASTLIMLFTVGWLAGITWRQRAAYALITFGVWDIFYYVWLKVLTGWPHSLLDWDALFLIPLPWWGPVLAPVLISLLMISWGAMVIRRRPPAAPAESGWKAWALCGVGVVLALYVFMTDSIEVVRQGGGHPALREVLPAWFNWPLFVVALVLMSAPIVAILREGPPRNQRGRRAFDHAKWLAHFATNRQGRPEPEWTAVKPELRAEILGPLVHSLEQFRLGDGGGPASLIAYDAERFRSSTSEMPAIVDAWFAEEAEHARLLGCAVQRFGGRRIESHWSFTAFCLCRRALGVRFELQVLTLTELVSTAYYRVLRRHSPDAPVAAMCALILRDEAGHVAFQRDRLAAAGCRPRAFLGTIWRTQFWLLGHAAAAMLWINHGPCLTVIGGSRKEYFREVRRELGRFIVSLNRRVAGETRPSERLPNLFSPAIKLNAFSLNRS